MRSAILLTCFILLPATYGIAAHPPVHPASGGVLRELNIASYGGSGANTIQAIATDASGNIFVAGTTSSPDLPVKNAEQPKFAEARILRSTDLGTTWTSAGRPPDDTNALAPDPVSPQVLFAGTASGIYRSTDAGQTWTLVYSSSTSTLTVDPGNHLRLAALVSVNSVVTLVRSLDGGDTWTPGGTPCSNFFCGGQLLADPAGTGTLLTGSSISRDWGLTFQPIAPPGGLANAIAFDPSHPGWIYADTARGVLGTLFLSKDYGATWSTKASPPTTFSSIQNLAVDPDQPSTLLATTADGLYKSIDGAASWTLQSGQASRFSPAGNFPFMILSHRCAPAGGLFALGSGLAGSYQIAFSPDYGATWGTPHLTQATSVVAGSGCAVYVTRQIASDAFVSKLAPDGQPLWTTFLGGADADTPVGLVLDSQGNAYVAGNTSSPDFPSTVPRIGVPGPNAVFVTKFSSGGKLVYSVLLSGESNNTASALTVDGNQNIYLAGSIISQSLVTPGTLVTKLGPGSYSCFLVKLDSSAALVWGTYLGEFTAAGALLVDTEEQVIVAGSGPLPGSTLPPGASPEFVLKLDPAASRMVSSIYLPGPIGGTPSALALDQAGNLLVSGATFGTDFPVTPGAYHAPEIPSDCVDNINYLTGGDLYIIKLASADWKPVYSALLQAPCGIQAGPMLLDSSGAIVLGVASRAGLPLHNPMLGAPTCPNSASAIARLSPDGATLTFATYLDNCGVPGIALAPDGTIYAGASTTSRSEPATVLHLNPATGRAVSLDRISNAFSGDASAVVGGGLYTLNGSGFSPGTIDLGLNARQDLPVELGGIQVTFDGSPAAILQTAPGRIIVAPPAELPAPHRNGHVPGFTAAQLFYQGASSNVVWMPVSTVRPGLLTRDFPNLLPHADFADGNIINADGTQNDADHPASAGSTITVFATGTGGALPFVAPGSIAHAQTAIPATPLYSSFQSFSLPPPAPVTVYSVPGFVSALVQIPIQVPSPIPNFNAPPLANGVQRVPISFRLVADAESFIAPVSNVVAVYLK